MNSKLKILLLDDRPENNSGIKGFLKRDFEIFEETDVRNAINFLENNFVNIIITDQKMPYMNGIDFLKECEKIQPKAVRILISGHVDKKDLQRSIEEGIIFRFLHKPISLDWELFDRAIEDASIASRLASANKS